MSAGSVSVKISGNLTSSAASCNGVNSTSSGPVFRLQLKDSTKSAAQEESSTVRTIDSAGGFTDLGLPSNLAARLFYLRVQTISPMSIRLTTEVTGITVLPSTPGMFLHEFAADDRLTMVEIQGQGTVEWYASGDVV